MNTELFPKRLKTLRKSRNITLEELSKSVGTTKVTLSRYENGDRSPKLEIVALLAKYFDVEMTWLSGVDESEPPYTSNILTQITKASSKLIEPRQNKVLNFATKQLQQQEKSNVSSLEEYRNRKKVPFPSYRATGAGIGEELYDDILSEEVYFYEDEIPDTADFCIFVNGDSMEPALRQGTYCFIQNIQQLKDGLVALVIYDGTVLIKKIALDEKEVRLVSLNPKYDDIIVKDHQQFKLVGKVVQ
ncbi:helix-turn-helix domain-containing protein [Staphylococcus xylosus]|uniref:helix-turn-helix domain-containing protein n=1 Tax=Staphylococcus xylosus TaxID=1288 RepID=UPI000E697772|nr:LexA family transcriptional regulator [Staphylococcus xylosus]RIM85826.1 helix-turn-helix domain-containing protein [Staphylococcus xylosus]